MDNWETKKSWASQAFTGGPFAYSYGNLCNVLFLSKVSKGAKIRNRYNQVPHLISCTPSVASHAGLRNGAQFIFTLQSSNKSKLNGNVYDMLLDPPLKLHSL